MVHSGRSSSNGDGAGKDNNSGRMEDGKRGSIEIGPVFVVLPVDVVLL